MARTVVLAIRLIVMIDFSHASNDYRPVKFDLTKNFKEGLDEGGISIPFPQRDLHLIDHGSERTAIG